MRQRNVVNGGHRPRCGGRPVAPDSSLGWLAVERPLAQFRMPRLLAATDCAVRFSQRDRSPDLTPSLSGRGPTRDRWDNACQPVGPTAEGEIRDLGLLRSLVDRQVGVGLPPGASGFKP